MTAANIAGWAIIAIFAVIGFVVVAKDMGLRTAVAIFGVSLGLTAVLVFAAYLIST